jgi:hypothetical protein
MVQSLPLELAAVEATQGASPPIPSEAEGSLKQEIPREALARNGETGDQLSKILHAWPQILEKVKEYNHSLLASLKLSQPTGIEGKELILAFSYKFHKDAIDARKNRIVVDQVIEEVTGLKLMVKPVLQKNAQVSGMPGESKDTMVESALKILGGEVENQ